MIKWFELDRFRLPTPLLIKLISIHFFNLTSDSTDEYETNLLKSAEKSSNPPDLQTRWVCVEVNSVCSWWNSDLCPVNMFSSVRVTFGDSDQSSV